MAIPSTRLPIPRAVRPWLAAGVLVLPTLLAACSSGDGGPGASTTNFESDDPTGRMNRDGAGSATGGSGGTGGSSSGGSSTGGGNTGGEGDPNRAIEEADVVKLEDGKLYALSQYGGLSVIDVSVRDRLTMLGGHKIVARPFEMYVREGIVIALYNGFADYAYDADSRSFTYFQTSYVVTLDARDPANVVELGRFAVGGDISDSRIVGDILYVAAFENGYCWNCPQTPRTNVMSLDVSTLTDIRKVDELHFEEREEYSWKRSLTATDERLYIAGPTWGSSEPTGSTIQVVDISDPGGDMVPGAEVQASGQIDSRWQMDEHDGVLRVISQPFAWRVDRAPEIQIFRIESAQTVTPLGRATMTLPQPERLQSVRFDGTRAYAITFQQIDPLFTIDLRDPQNPRQVGELVMPGWVYHMEPRGDRVLGLGFDQGNAEGSITVSLFDVSDLEKPAMLDRVNFGGDWGSLAEDQDRIHKAFNILDDEGLVLVPFSGWSNTDDADSCYWGRFLSGVQLIDWHDDALELRGVAPSVGQARRGLLHDQRLITMSDERVESFDITDRDTPSKRAALPIAKYVTHTAAVGDKVLRVGQNWWTNVAELDVTNVDDAGKPTATGAITLPELDSRNTCQSSSWLGEVYSNASHAYLVYDTYEYDPNRGTSARSVRVLTVDVSDATKPKVAGNVSLGLQPNYYYGYGYGYGYGLVQSGAGIVNVGSTLVLSDRTLEWSSDGPRAVPGSLKVVDLADPETPRVRSVALPSSLGFTGLLASGDVIATSHYERSPANPDRVRFYVDRVDISNPDDPRVLPKVNVPGSLVAFDAESSHAVTTDYRRVTVSGVTYATCYDRYGSYSFEAGDREIDEETLGRCTVVEQTLLLVHLAGDHATVVDSMKLPLGEAITSTALGDDRLFAAVGRANGYYGSHGGYYGYYTSFSETEMPLVVISGIRSGSFRAARLELSAGDSWGQVPVVASGTRAALSTGFRGKLVVIDADDAAAPSIAREVDLGGWVQDLDVVGDSAIASLGYDGAQTISLRE
ncbi:MAG TPA: beta-propeller domain-containing protein [Polyangiaceae bacterium]